MLASPLYAGQSARHRCGVRVITLLVALVVVATAPALADGALVPTGAGISTPAGFRTDVVAKVVRPTALARDGAGRVWITSADGSARPTGKVLVLPKLGGQPRPVILGLRTPLGLTWFRRELYVSSTGRVDAYSGFAAGRFTRHRKVIANLPVGLHQNDAIVPGPDGRLYLGLGSPCDACTPSKSRSATVLSFLPSGRDVRVVARGLRNPYGLAFVPGSGDLLVTEEGRDDLGLKQPPEELNVVRAGSPPPDFGYPRCVGQGGALCREKTPAFATFPAHAAAGGVVVTAGDFGPVTTPSAFVALYGSSFRPPTGRHVVRVSLMTPVSTVIFARGFKNPLALLMTPNRELLVGDFTSGRIYRIRPR